MNRLEAVAGASLVALVAAGIGQKYSELAKLAGTPPPAGHVLPKLQLETRPARTVDAAIAAYLAGAEAADEADKRVHLGSLLASLGQTNRHLTRLISLARLRGAEKVGDRLETALGGQIVAAEGG